MATHTIETISPCERRILSTIDKHRLQKVLSAEIKKNKHLGPRKGGFRTTQPHYYKTAISMLAKTDPVTLENLYQHACKIHVEEILKQESIAVLGSPVISRMYHNADTSISYSADFEIPPPISHVNWHEVTLEKLSIPITEADIDIVMKDTQSSDNPEESDKLRKNWKAMSEHIVENAQYQHLNQQIREALLMQNTLDSFPPRFLEAHYQSLKNSDTKNTQNEDTLRKNAQTEVTLTLLFMAYAKEHNIQVDPEKLKLETDQLINEYIAYDPSFIKQFSTPLALFRYAASRAAPIAFQKQIIEHLAAQANFTIKEKAYLELIGFSAAESTIMTETVNHTENTTNEEDSTA
jgi:FKBP-type peptidyl-prolyl cis-trans isomerase (trigger factor)